MNNDVPMFSELEGLFGNLVSAIIGLGGIVLFIMLVIGGYSFITSKGQPPKIEAARKIITHAILGIIIIALSYLFLKVISTFTGVDVTIFNVTQ